MCLRNAPFQRLATRDLSAACDNRLHGRLAALRITTRPSSGLFTWGFERQSTYPSSCRISLFLSCFQSVSLPLPRNRMRMRSSRASEHVFPVLCPGHGRFVVCIRVVGIAVRIRVAVLRAVPGHVCGRRVPPTREVHRSLRDGGCLGEGGTLTLDCISCLTAKNTTISRVSHLEAFQ